MLLLLFSVVVQFGREIIAILLQKAPDFFWDVPLSDFIPLIKHTPLHCWMSHIPLGFLQYYSAREEGVPP